MTFGARASPGVWERYGYLLAELFRLWQPDSADIVRWVDDYLCVFTGTEAEAETILSLLRFVAARYGFPLKAEKIEGPSISLEFIGWEWAMDLCFPTVSIPPGKRARYIQSASRTLACPCRRCFDKVCGKLYDFARVFTGLRQVAGRINAHRLRLPDKEPRRRAAQRLPSAIADDIVWSARVITSVPRVRALRTHTDAAMITRESAEIWLQTDASSSFGQGIVIRRAPNLPSGRIAWLSRSHTSQERSDAFVTKTMSSSVFEAFAIRTATLELAKLLAGRTVWIDMDNEGAVRGLIAGRADSPRLNKVVRNVAEALIWLGASVHFNSISRSDKQLADALSMNRIPMFFQMARSLGLSPLLSPVPCRSPERQGFFQLRRYCCSRD